MNTDVNSNTVIRIENLHFEPFRDGISVAKIDWFNLVQAKVFRYPAGHYISLHYLSNEILLTVLKGRIKFQDANGNIETAEGGTFRKCGTTPWTTEILEESYILVIEETDTETIMVDQQPEVVQTQVNSETPIRISDTFIQREQSQHPVPNQS
jgi:hypothetical protein